MRISSALFLGISLLFAANLGAKDIKWQHLSSRYGDLPAPNGGRQQTVSLVLDIDKDGKDDFIIGERLEAPALVWYRFTGKGWEKLILENNALNVEAGGAYADIDGDGDLDVVFGGQIKENRVWWWENPYPNFDPKQAWKRHVIKDQGERIHHDQVFGDLDGDGRPELVFWNQMARTLFMAPIPKDVRTAPNWPLTPVYAAPNQLYQGLACADVDGDGKLDILGAAMWFRNEGDGKFTPTQLSDLTNCRIAAGQLIKDGWQEIVISPGDSAGPLGWFQWDGVKWIGHQLVDKVERGHSLQIGDVDGDGNLDIFCAEMRLNGGNENARMWVFYGDGQGNFRTNLIATGQDNHESRLGDFNGDGLLDILDKPFNLDTPRVDLWLQTK